MRSVASRRPGAMLASPYASTSTSAPAYSYPASAAALSPGRPPSTTSRRSAGSRSSSTSLSSAASRDPATPDARTLAESLLREEEGVDAASPATSEGGGPPTSNNAMDVCEDGTGSVTAVAPPSQATAGHTKLSRRISVSSSSAGSAGHERRPSDTSRPARRKAPRVDASVTPSADITACPPAELLSLLASLLQHVAKTNDARRGPKQPAATCCPPEAGEDDEVMEDVPARRRVENDWTLASRQAHGSTVSTLCFHARNVPSIAIEAYLLRILKYCPTTNEVFIALLVYFDRMARAIPAPPPATSSASSSTSSPIDSPHGQHGPGLRGFAVDSFNVHRLLIAGVTVASKFMSDVFYTNSRYAKVGGLPLNELNQLELQFLLLNDFQLTISLEELQRYADYLLVRWRPPPSLPLASSSSSPPPPVLHHRPSDSSDASSSADTARADEDGMVA